MTSMLIFLSTTARIRGRSRFRGWSRARDGARPALPAFVALLPEPARCLSNPLGLGLAALTAVLASGCGNGSEATGLPAIAPPAGEPEPVGDVPAFPFVSHLDQREITSGRVRFDELFTIGDELFEASFTGLDGSGVLRLPDGTALPRRFSRVPPGGGRFTGPNGQACVACHNSPLPTSAGEAAGSVAQDPAGAGLPPFNFRNATSLFGAAALQRLAEEITEELLGIRDAVAAEATAGGPAVQAELRAKGISYGVISAQRAPDGSVSFDTSGVKGVTADLVVRPYGWKGNVTTLRDFVRAAADNELGMQPKEIVDKGSAGPDPDGDGVEEEFSVGDITALAVYVGAQEIPSTRAALTAQALLPPPAPANAGAAARGEQIFRAIGCAHCHVTELRLDDPVFEEPTRRGDGNYADPDIDPSETALDPMQPFRFNLVMEGDRPRLTPAAGGGAIVALLGDLKRHNMGSHLADAQPTPVRDASGAQLVLNGVAQVVDESTFLTAELWGTGSTGPWLHDGRAGSLDEAIRLHGTDAPPPSGDPGRSEAQEARDAFTTLSADDASAVVEFLKSLVLFAFPEAEE